MTAPEDNYEGKLEPGNGGWWSSLPNWQIRCLLGSIMIILFAILVSCGHFVVILMTVGIQTIVFNEVISVAYMRYRERELPWFRTMNWYRDLASIIMHVIYA